MKLQSSQLSSQDNAVEQLSMCSKRNRQSLNWQKSSFNIRRSSQRLISERAPLKLKWRLLLKSQSNSSHSPENPASLLSTQESSIVMFWKDSSEHEIKRNSKVISIAASLRFNLFYFDQICEAWACCNQSFLLSPKGRCEAFSLSTCDELSQPNICLHFSRESWFPLPTVTSLTKHAPRYKRDEHGESFLQFVLRNCLVNKWRRSVRQQRDEAYQSLLFIAKILLKAHCWFNHLLRPYALEFKFKLTITNKDVIWKKEKRANLIWLRRILPTLEIELKSGEIP